jgi:hypothetical protein
MRKFEFKADRLQLVSEEYMMQYTRESLVQYIFQKTHNTYDVLRESKGHQNVRQNKMAGFFIRMI